LSQVTSFHKDHYENIYCVMAGSKTFHLVPPPCVGLLESSEFRSATWTRKKVSEFC